jgi:hypothetical protein
MTEEKINKELAEKEFLDWCELNDLETDTAEMDDKEKVLFEGARKSAIKMIQKGRLIVDGEKLEYTVSNFSPAGFAGEKLTISRPNGSIYLALDGKNSGEMHRINAAMSALVGKDTGWLAKLDAKADWTFLNRITQLFLL